jgi:hypothetical protein
MPAKTYTGTDTELDYILGDTYACTRVWEAWQVGTMTEDDFQAVTETEIAGDLIAWRDAAVAAERERWLASETESVRQALHGGPPIDPRRNYR